MLNRVTLVGRLTRDLELRSSVNGKPYVGFTLAVNSNFSDQAAFIPCYAWNKTAENMVKYLNKGSLIALDGRIYTRVEVRDGVQYTIVQVVANSISFLNSTTKKEPVSETEPIKFDGDDAILWD